MNTKFKIPISKPVFNNGEERAILSVLKNGWVREGKVTKIFENKISKYLSSNVVTVNSGSSALLCALIAHGIKSSDKIVVPDFTFIATSSIPKILGAKIIPVDVDFDSLVVNPETLEKVVKKHNVSCVIAVDIGGSPVDLEAFSDLSKHYGFTLIEDAAQAFGSEYKKKKLGSFDHTTIFSFQTTKPLTTIEGGCVSSSEKRIIKKIRSIKDFGRSESGNYIHSLVGSNFRTTDIASAVGICQLEKFDSNIVQRNRIFSKYKKFIKNLKFQKIPKYVTKNSNSLIFASVNNEKNRNSLVKKLVEKRIDARKPWGPIHLQPCNTELKKFSCKNSEMIYRRFFNLPIFNDMTDKEVKTVVESINKFNKV